MFGLAFLSPVFLAGAAAAAIPIALHLFHRRTDPVIDFAAMRYLRSAPVEQASRRRIKELVLLALRVAALVMLAVAFARPYVAASAAALAAPATIVVLDTSASLSAPGQFGRARALAAAAIRSAPVGHVVGVMTFGNGVALVAPLSSDRAGALTALEGVTPGAGATRYRAAFGRAAEVLGDRSGRLVVVTDMQESGWDTAGEGSVSEQVRVEVVDVGSPASNVAVSSIRVDGTEAVAFVRNYSTHTVVEQVAFAIDGTPIGAVPVTVAAGGGAEARLGLSERTGSALAASVGDRDGYAADNVRYAVMDVAAPPSVLMITTSGSQVEAFYVSRALAIAEGAGGFRQRLVSGPQFSDLGPQDLLEVDVLAVFGTRGLEHRGRELLAGYLKRGGGVFVGAGPDVDPAVIKESLSGSLRTTWRVRDALASPASALRFAPDDSRHPVFRLFGGVGTLANVSFQRAALVAPAESADIIARFSDGSPALVDESTGRGRVLIFASDLNRQWNDFPLQPAFVPFVHESLRYLASARASRTEYLVGDLPGSVGGSPGIVRVGGAEGPGRRVAVNVDARESDPTHMDAEAFGASVSRLHGRAAVRARAEVRDREDGQRLWQYGLLLMIVSLAAESMVGRRLG